MRKLFLCLSLLSVLIGCITDFAPEVEGVRGILVGMLAKGDYFMYSFCCGPVDCIVSLVYDNSLVL